MAFGSVSDILLRITGDQSDAADAIAELAGELAVFAKQDAEAKADIATEEALNKLRELRARLEAIDLDKAEPEVKAKVAIALAELELVEGKMSDLDGETATVDVDVRRGALERLGAASNSVLNLTKRVRGLGGASEGLFSNLSDVGLIVGPFAARIGTIGQVVAILSPLIVSLGGALVALAGSLGAAALAAGALAVAFGGVLVAGVGLAFAAIARFKDQADTAGTPANALKTAFQGIGNAAKALLPAVDPVLKALASGLNTLKPLIGALAPAFRNLGQFAGAAIQSFVDILASPEIVAGVNNLLRLAGPAFTPLAQIAGQLFRIFLNIAQAALPALNLGLQTVAGWLTDIGNATSNVSGLRGSINQLMGPLGTWLSLLSQIGQILFGILKAGAGPGTQLVGFLRDGAQALADWVNSSEGQDRIKQFFADTMPLVRQLVGLVAQLAVIFVQVGEILAPILEPVAAILNVLLGYVTQLLEAFLSLPAPVRNSILGIIAIVVALLTGVGEVTAAVLLIVGAITLVATAFKLFGGAATAAFNAIKSAIGTVFGLLKAPLKLAIAMSPPGLLIGQAKNIWSAVKSIVTGSIEFVLKIVRDPLGAARSLWNGVKGVISRVVSFVMRVPTDPRGAARSLWGAVKGVISAAISFVLHMPGVGSLVGVAKSIWDAINSALPDITIEIHIPTPHLPNIHLSPARPLSELGERLAQRWAKDLGKNMHLLTRAIQPEFQAAAEVLASSSGDGGALAAIPSPLAAPASDGQERTTVFHNTINAPAGEQPDPASTLALLEMKARARNQR